VDKQFFVYILASGRRGTLYIGATSNLPQRIWQHRAKEVPGFTSDYDVTRLVWYEPHEGAESATIRERRLKHWKRDWKIQLIETTNPHWQDLYDQLGP
jgi:putative endonuclease